MVLGIFCCGVARAQLAPGPLSSAHADLDGITRCGSCHDFGARRLKCLECHVEIRDRVEAGTGYHSQAYKSSPGETDCARCHAEHRGPKLGLVALDRKSFDHGAQTGFPLEGKHRVQKCESCHTATKIAAGARPAIKIKDLNRTFLGLRRDCISCHQEPHQNQLGKDCPACHTLEAWKPASRFDHSRAAFPLTGLHRQVLCEKCHAGVGPGKAGDRTQAAVGEMNSNKAVLFKGLTFSSCRSCHEDRHRGAFQAVKISGKCEDCHDTGGWKNNHPGSDFNHNLTKFRLVGKHAELACGKCHKGSDFGRPIPHGLCRDCHDDPHSGQFAARAGGSDCFACHGTSQFKPPLFDRAAHMQAAFPLEGKHATLPCLKCHQPEGRNSRYMTGKLTCSACHPDPHGGEFASEPYGNECRLCHTPAGFQATTFSRERHAQTQFPLTGRHAEVECHKCHKPLKPIRAEGGPDAVNAPDEASAAAAPDKTGASAALRQYHFASRSCSVCHPDPHEIDQQAIVSCSTCHIPQQWKTLNPFDHSTTRFKLEGEHADAAHPIACVKCHEPTGQAAGRGAATAPLFSRSSTQCSRCHGEKDAHGGQFTGTADRRTDCSGCHAPAAWKAASFDHDATRFPLSIAHRKVTCVKCHKEQKEVDGKMVRVYRNTPVQCLKCH